MITLKEAPVSREEYNKLLKENEELKHKCAELLTTLEMYRFQKATKREHDRNYGFYYTVGRR